MRRWSSGTDTNGRLWTRPLDWGEEKFFWFAECNGRLDMLARIVFTVENTDVVALENTTRAWIRVKQAHPLLAAEAVASEAGRGQFIVRESRLTGIVPGETELRESMEDRRIELIAEEYLNGPRRLSSKNLASLSVIRSSPSNDSTEQAQYHAFFYLSHLIADGIAVLIIARTFFENLVSMKQPKSLSELDIPLILESVASFSSLSQTPQSMARKRWRRAIAWAILRTRGATVSSGHALPRKVTSRTATTSPISRSYGIEINQLQTRRMLSTCRAHRVTFGHAFIVLKQIAHMRTIGRLRHAMSPREWSYRINQPMHFIMPVNLRHKIPSEGLVGDSRDPVLTCMGLMSCTLPPISRKVGGSLLDPREFWSRCRSVKRQGEKALSHPLLLEICEVQDTEMLGRLEKTARIWDCDDVQLATIQEYPPDAGAPKNILANAGSSFGDLEKFLPPTHLVMHEDGQRSRLVINSFRVQERVLPLNLYLTAIGSSSGTWIGGWWDGAAYEDSLVRLWMHEVVDLAKFYLADGGVMEEGDVRQARL